MFIIMLLFSQVWCDWVEISQNHYRKEPLHNITVNDYTTKANYIYRNHSLPEKHWNRGVVDKVINVGNIRRVHIPSVKASSFKTRYGENMFKDFDDHEETLEADYNFVSVRPNIPKGNTHSVELAEKQNIATQLAIRTTTTNYDHVKRYQSDPNSKPLSKQKTSAANDFNSRKIFQEDKLKEGTIVHNLNKVKQEQISKMPLTETINKNMDKFSFDDVDKIVTIEKQNIRRVSQSDELKLMPKKSDNRQFNPGKESVPPKIKLIQEDDNIRNVVRNVEENDVIHSMKQGSIFETNNKINDHSHENNNSYKTTINPMENYFDTTKKFDYQISASHEKRNYIKNSNKPKDLTIFETITEVPVIQSDNEEIIKLPEDKETFSEGLSNVTKGKTVNGILKLLKIITDTVYKNTHRNFKSKIKYLERLKSTILTSIVDHIDRAWPDDVQGVGARSTRSAHARGHVEFPSSESTLMTISFLTFAVFLIKLVLQVIHTYKNKTMMVTPAVVAAVGRAVAALKSPQ